MVVKTWIAENIMDGDVAEAKDSDQDSGIDS